MDNWVVVGVDPEAIWWSPEAEVTFRGRQLLLRPGDERGALPDVAIRCGPGESIENAATFVHRFLSVMVWKRRAYIRVVGHGGGSPHPSRVGGRREAVGLRVAHLPAYDATDLPIATTPQQDLALALYREAMGLQDATYQFLGFFRIFNITLPTRMAHVEWINAHLPHLVAYTAERARDILSCRGDVGRYLYEAGRSALAHAAVPPVIDPDLMSDARRIGLDCILVDALVQQYMQEVLGLPTYD